MISPSLVLLPIWLASETGWFILVSHLNFVVLYWVFSLTITTISTMLIVYRITNMAQLSNRTTTVEILVESGAMYTIVIIICCALWVQSKPSPAGVIDGGVYITSDIIYSLLIPVTVSHAVLVIHSGSTQKLSVSITGDCTDINNPAHRLWSCQRGC